MNNASHLNFIIIPYERANIALRQLVKYCRKILKCWSWHFVCVVHLSVTFADDCRRFHFRDPARLKTRLVTPGGPLLQIFQDFFKSRVTCGETFNFMKGLYLHKDYVNIKKFVTWRGKGVFMYLAITKY